ncbi:hypothetical protein [Amycolatopsis minnesotensis]|uniref:Uncharacterized protein n=1 Tax=Amycolatopsis minnesotensis TaxID=337894 RepID=A0ABP5CDI9_9PSEU
MKKVLATLAATCLGVAACSAPPAPAPPAAPPAPPPVSHPQAAPPVHHQVTVKVRGPVGSVFRVSGAVFGNTGLVDMPGNGEDSASFATEDTGNLGLSVSVMAGPDPRGCIIEIDGAAVVTQTAQPEYPVTCTTDRAA